MGSTVTEQRTPGTAERDDAAEPQPTEPGAGWRTTRASLAAVADGVLAVVGVLVLLSVIALTGWFSADAGLRWEPRTALRVAADVWSLGQGASLVQAWGSITVVPLGVTVLSVLAARRAGRRVADRAEDDVTDLDVATAAALVAGGYLVATLVVVVLAGAEETGPSLLRALLGATMVVLAGAVPPLLVRTGRWPAYAAAARGALPGWLPGAVRRAGAALVLLLGVSAAMLGALMLRHADAAAAAVSALQPTPLDAVVLGLACLLVLPVLVVWTASWLVGSGISLGTGTLVAPSAVTLGPLPAVPFVAVVPDSAPPGWMESVTATPAVIGLLTVLLMRRTRPATLLAAVAQAVTAGALVGLALGLLGAAASGGIGPGRLAEVGVPVLELAVTGAAATALGGVLAAVVLALLDRRRAAAGGGADLEDTIEITVETTHGRAFTPSGWRQVVPPAEHGGRRAADADGRRGGR